MSAKRLQDLSVLWRYSIVHWWGLGCLGTIWSWAVACIVKVVSESRGESLCQEVDRLRELGLCELVGCISRSLDN